MLVDDEDSDEESEEASSEEEESEEDEETARRKARKRKRRRRRRRAKAGPEGRNWTPFLDRELRRVVARFGAGNWRRKAATFSVRKSARVLRGRWAYLKVPVPSLLPLRRR